ncbi:MAG: NAD-binding protein, partial [Saprospiraceae bacterium]|nr:NAD-binding protein [Saprospiraceae bacterium]
MKIIIAGAGAVGFHLAELLVREDQEIVLIDTNEEALHHAATHLDVLTIRGDAASTDVLMQANVAKTKLLLAVTTSEKTNLLVAILAKQMGAKKTIARVSNPEYLEPSQKEIFQKLGIDT